MRSALDKRRDSAPARRLLPLLGHLGSRPLDERQRAFVDTFDLSRKHALYLSYWTDGDTHGELRSPYAGVVTAVCATLVSVGAGSEAHNYRETVSPWFRSVFFFSPDVASMAAAPIQFHIHALVGMSLFALWPFTRLVHAFTAPLHYQFRPYIVYRSRDRAGASGSRTGRPGWSGVGTTDRDRQR